MSFIVFPGCLSSKGLVHTRGSLWLEWNYGESEDLRSSPKISISFVSNCCLIMFDPGLGD